MCDTIDMNTLGEGEECAVCMEEMEEKKCYRSGASLFARRFYLKPDFQPAMQTSCLW